MSRLFSPKCLRPSCKDRQAFLIHIRCAHPAFLSFVHGHDGTGPVGVNGHRCLAVMLIRSSRVDGSAEKASHFGVTIQGNATGAFLCFTRRGRLTTRVCSPRRSPERPCSVCVLLDSVCSLPSNCCTFFVCMCCESVWTRICALTCALLHAQRYLCLAHTGMCALLTTLKACL